MGFSDTSGIVALVITVVISVISYVTPYWLETETDYVVGRIHMGLLAYCDEGLCRWLYEDGMFMQKHQPDWFQATQVLMSVGQAASLVALLIATLSLCCTCQNCNPNNPVSGLLIIAFLTMGVAVGIFGLKASDQWSIELNWDVINSNGRFGWSFWVAIGATVMSLLTSIIYGCMSRKYHS